MTYIRALWAQTPRTQDGQALSLSVQVIFEAMFTFKSPFFSRTQGLNSRINTTGRMSSSKFRHTKYWAIIFCSVSPSKNWPWYGLYVHQVQLLWRFYIEKYDLLELKCPKKNYTGSFRCPAAKLENKEPFRNLN